MKQKANYPKVASDMFMALSSWTFALLGVMLIVQIIKGISLYMNGNELDTYYNAVFVAAGIYMFVIGILTTFFLAYYVENGVTRKDYYKGALLSSIGLSFMIPIITLVISSFLQFLLTRMDIFTFKAAEFNTSALDVEAHIVSDIVLTFILSPYVDPSSNWFLSILVYAINIFFYYLIGWLIGTGFYRFNTIIGLGTVFIGLVIMIIKDSLLRTSLELPIPDRIITTDFIPASMSEIGLIVSGLVLIILIRYFTKNASVKI
ncbi:hypothetical protein H8S33_05280 [Ornithinibacillus sp. BX22]|uniref:Uncharacterized protein n=2 Tax=Ornithinibacillus TaxID=484508 RepID=A0A923L4B8_9BACI|nr:MULTISPECIES: hypothetical protein [Ornithinibacillus]MBC5636240.1 hypothetical protein [Ornithinibacillus hominis]MBS3681081.1 hypothetical protein [Ornithinibacillus massiliensis]